MIKLIKFSFASYPTLTHVFCSVVLSCKQKVTVICEVIVILSIKVSNQVIYTYKLCVSETKELKEEGSILNSRTSSKDETNSQETSLSSKTMGTDVDSVIKVCFSKKL